MIQISKTVRNAVSALLACPASVLGQLSTFTGASTNNPVNWCDATNWDPSGIPANGADIAVGPSHTANMAQCDASTRILGDVSAAGTIRFYTPVTFAGDATLNNPIFELSTTPAVVGGQILISGNNAWWQGAIFSGGSVINTGLLSVERSFISGRTSPRELTNGGTFTNDGTVRLFQGFKINGGATFSNQGTLTCEATATIGRDNGNGVIQNNGNISVPAGLGITITSGLVSDGEINSTGTLTLQSETTLRGTARVLSGGTVRALAIFNHPVVIGPVNLEGEGNIQLSEGAFQIGAVTSSARGPAGRGLWIGSTDDLDISQGSISISEGGLLTWSLGDFNGGNGLRATPHISIASGARMNVSGAPGQAGGGDALGTHIRVEGEMYQNATARILSGSRLVIPTIGKYILSHTRMDGDGTVLLEVRGTFDVNPPEDTSTATTFLNAVDTKLLGSARMNVSMNDLITSSSPIQIGGDVEVDIGHGARWRAFSEVIVIDGSPLIAGGGTFELTSGTPLTITDAGLTIVMTGAGDFTQRGPVRAGVGATAASLYNEGNWHWLAGDITLPQGDFASVTNLGFFVADCGQCQLRADFSNGEQATIVDTVVLALPGIEFINTNEMYLLGSGSIVDASAALEGRLANHSRVYKDGAGTSVINTTLDNESFLEVRAGTLFIFGPIVQYSGGALTGGHWSISSGATLSTPGRIISTVGPGATVSLAGTWVEFQPVMNSGDLYFPSGTHSFSHDFENFGDVTVDTGATVTVGGNRFYSQRAGVTRVQAGASLTASQPVAVTGGTLAGSGTVTAPAVNNSGGTVAPGTSPGTLTIAGAYTQSASGSLDIELAGLAPGTQHDVLAVTGTANLGGTLRVTRLNGYVPALGDTFTFLTAASVQGAFTTIDAPGFSLTYLSNAARLTFVGLPPPCPADFNGDGFLDFFDYSDFVECFETEVCGGGTADFNGDGFVDFFDYADFVLAFETGC